MTTTTHIEKVTPAKAREWLERNNTRNRNLRPHKVALYADQMTRGQWLMAGDPIRFDSDGTLLDGQHRLAAVVESGKAQYFIIVMGLDPRTFGVMDIGMARTPGDSLGSDVKSGKVSIGSPLGSQTMVTMLAKNSRDDLAVMAELLESGKVRPVIDRTYPIAEAAAALSYLGEGHAKGKIVISV